MRPRQRRRRERVSDVVSVEVNVDVPPLPSGQADGPSRPAAGPEAQTRRTPRPRRSGSRAPARGRTRQAAPANHAARTVRVDAERLDALMHSMGELVIHRTAVEALTAGLEVPELQHAVQDLTRSSQALQAMVMQVRMIPVDVVFLRFPRLIRDLSTKLGKEVELELVGKRDRARPHGRRRARRSARPPRPQRPRPRPRAA